MEGTLLVTPEKLQETASDFGAQATQVKALHDDMMQKVKGLSSTWTGSAADAYLAKFSALQTSMDKINRMINEHVNDLNEMAQQFISADTSAASIAGELPASEL